MSVTTSHAIPHQRFSDDPVGSEPVRRSFHLVEAERPGPGPSDPGPAARVVSGAPRLDLVRAALTGGARGYLFPATAREPVVEPAAVPPFAGTATVLSADGTEAQLTGREVGILQLVANGRTNREIADELGLSAFTVKSHLSRIGQRLRSGDRAQLVMLALRAGVIG